MVADVNDVYPKALDYPKGDALPVDLGKTLIQEMESSQIEKTAKQTPPAKDNPTANITNRLNILMPTLTRGKVQTGRFFDITGAESEQQIDEHLLSTEIKTFLVDRQKHLPQQLLENRYNPSFFTENNLRQYKKRIHTAAEEIFLEKGRLKSEYIEAFGGEAAIAQNFSGIVNTETDEVFIDSMEGLQYCLLKGYVFYCASHLNNLVSKAATENPDLLMPLVAWQSGNTTVLETLPQGSPADNPPHSSKRHSVSTSFLSWFGNDKDKGTRRVQSMPAINHNQGDRKAKRRNAMTRSALGSLASGRKKVQFAETGEGRLYTKFSDELEPSKKCKQGVMVAELAERVERKKKSKKEQHEEGILLRNAAALQDYAIPGEETAPNHIRSVHPLKVNGVLKAGGYPTADDTHKLANNIDAHDPKTFIPSIKNNLNRIEGLGWIDGLHGKRGEGPGVTNNLLGEDQQLLEVLSWHDSGRGILVERIKAQKCYILECKEEITLHGAKKSQEKKDALQKWNSSGIGKARTACMPTLDILEQAIRENTLASLDSATLLGFKRELINLSNAHKVLYQDLQRATIISNIENLDNLIKIIDSQITIQLSALGATEVDIASILAPLSEEDTLDAVIRLYSNKKSEEINTLIVLYRDGHISKQQFIFGCHIFEENNNVKEAFISFCQHPQNLDIAHVLIEAVKIFPGEITKLLELIKLFNSVKINKQELSVACQRLNKKEIVAAIMNVAAMQGHADRKNELLTLLIQNKMSEQEFIFSYEHLESNPKIVSLLMAAVRSEKEPSTRVKLFEQMHNKQSSVEVYQYALEQLPLKPELAKAIYRIQGASNAKFKEYVFKLLQEGKTSEKVFIEIGNVLEAACMDFGNAYRVLFKDGLIDFNAQATALLLGATNSGLSAEDKQHYLQQLAHDIAELNNNQKLSTAMRDRLLLNLCHYALWLEYHCKQNATRDALFDTAVRNLEFRAGFDIRKTEEYQYIQNVKVLRSKAVEESRFEPLCDIAQEFEAVVQNADFSEEDQNKAHQAFNIQCNTALSRPNTENANDTFAAIRTELASKGTAGQRTSGILGRIRGVATTIAGIGLIMTGVVGVLASATSMVATLGLSSPVALPGIWLSSGLIGTGVTMVTGGAVDNNLAKVKYDEACQAKQDWEGVSTQLATTTTDAVNKKQPIPPSPQKGRRVPSYRLLSGPFSIHAQPQQSSIREEVSRYFSLAPGAA